MEKTQEQVRSIVKGLIPTQQDIAKEIGIDPFYFSKWLNGRETFGKVNFSKVMDWIKSR